MFFALPAFGYVGPGLGGGVLAVFIGIISSLFFGLMAIVYFPIKRALKKKKPRNKEKDDQDDQEEQEGHQDESIL